MLTIENLSLAFDENCKAFEQISFSLRENTITLLNGPSGCGKSSLLMAIARVVPEIVEAKIEGRIIFRGRSVEKEEARSVSGEIGYVFQDPDSQLCTFTVEDEIAFGLENCRVDPEEMDQEIDRLLGLMNIRHLRKRNLNQLSGGEKQKVAIAAVLAVKPSLLLMDEPTANLDETSTREVVELIRSLRDDLGMTILLVEHRIREFAPVIDEVLHMTGDRVVTLPAGKYIQEMEHTWSLPRREKPRPSSPPVLEAEEIGFSYISGTPVLKVLSFSLGQGEILAITGPNGAGKSTLSRLLTGLIRPDRGRILAGGRDLSSLSPRETGQMMGIAFQNPEHQFICLTVEKELAYGQEESGRTPEEVINSVETALSRFDLSNRRHSNPFVLSQGQKRRLSTATMMMNGQRILILDEPTYGQDPENLGALVKLLYRINREGVSVLMITHDPDLVRCCCDRNLVLENGRLTEKEICRG